MNRIVLIGRLTDKPELRYTNSGTEVTNFTLAVDRNYSNKDGERDTDFIDVTCWRGLAETVAEHLGKGRLVAVDGSLQIKKSKSDGRTYVNPEVTADNVKFLDFADSNSNDKQEAMDGFDDFDGGGFN